MGVLLSMIIKKLIVRETFPKENIIRSIDFNKQGLSLIVDNTVSVNGQSGNGVGKSTVIQIIDLCLGGRTTKSLYYDSDTKSENYEIKQYIEENKVQAEIIFEDTDLNEVIIKRDLFTKGKKNYQ